MDGDDGRAAMTTDERDRIRAVFTDCLTDHGMTHAERVGECIAAVDAVLAGRCATQAAQRLTAKERDACGRVASMAASHVRQYARHWSGENLTARWDSIDTVRRLAGESS